MDLYKDYGFVEINFKSGKHAVAQEISMDCVEPRYTKLRETDSFILFGDIYMEGLDVDQTPLYLVRKSKAS